MGRVGTPARVRDRFVGNWLPISPGVGYFASRDELLLARGLEPANDSVSSHEDWTLLSDGSRAYAAWSSQTSPFCCVGTKHGGSRKPHNVDASVAQPRRALSHLVEWTLASFCEMEMDVVETHQCEACASAFLTMQPRLKQLTWDAFQAKAHNLRARRDHVAIESFMQGLM